MYEVQRKSLMNYFQCCQSRIVVTTDMWIANNQKKGYMDVTIYFTCRSGFTTLPPVLLQKQPIVILLFERDLVSWSLVMDERGRYEDLRGSDRRSVIPYVHGRTIVVLLKPALPESAFLSTLVKRHLPEPFIAQGRTVTLRPGV
jgi:hypothetical protein